MPDLGGVRLVGSSSPHEGLVQVQRGSRWAPLCISPTREWVGPVPPADPGAAAAVACRQLGFQGHVSRQPAAAYLPPGAAPPAFGAAVLACTGAEERLDHCLLTGQAAQPACSGAKNALAVRCGVTDKPLGEHEAVHVRGTTPCRAMMPRICDTCAARA